MLIAILVLFQTMALAQTETPFITKWQLNENDTISIQLANSVYDFDYVWTLLSNQSIVISGTHTSADGVFETLFETTGEYSLAITGAFPHLKEYPKDKLLDVLQWGDIIWESTEEMFKDWQGVAFSATDAPNLSGVSSMSRMFKNAANFNDDLSSWRVGSVNDMQELFQDATAFNGDISTWDVQNVSNMNAIFRNATNFNSDISGWETPSLVFLNRAFSGAATFNQEIGNWDVSQVKSLAGTFGGATLFNGDISNWNISANVTNMSFMFFNAKSFNQEIGNWNVSNVSDMTSLFSGASSFNGDISKWDVSSVTTMRRMFDNADSFNQQIESWNVSNCQTFREMFRQNDAFNQSLGGWKFNPDANFLNVFGGAIAIDCKSWSSTIIGLNFSNPELENIPLGGPNIEIDSVAARAQAELIARGWTVRGNPTPVSCNAEHHFPCQNDVVISNDTLYGNLYISAAKKVELDTLIFEKPCKIFISAPAVSISPLVAIEEGIVLEIVTEPGCTEN
ncbi:BspA family leucine-rich repeat surface protein [uncultured Arcticibacterium sp.]|uniref:BspA family leucine-rich repeat surface protein n=1 Tax=uncultured Arcticibacterium sp. TaxID=2173042 RepID=UPI0030FBD6ED